MFSSLPGGVAVVGRDLRVQVWNGAAEELWGVRAAEVQGQGFLELDIGLPTGALLPAIRSCLAGANSHEELVVPATDRRGRSMSCRVVVRPLATARAEAPGVIVLMNEAPGGA